MTDTVPHAKRSLSALGLIALVAAGCSSQEVEQPTPELRQAALSDIAAETTEQPMAPRAREFKAALTAAGVPDRQSDSTVLVVAQGICDQLAAGTPDSEILAKLGQLAAYTATLTNGQLTGDEIAALYLTKAKATFC